MTGLTMPLVLGFVAQVRGPVASALASSLCRCCNMPLSASFVKDVHARTAIMCQILLRRALRAAARASKAPYVKRCLVKRRYCACCRCADTDSWSELPTVGSDHPFAREGAQAQSFASSKRVHLQGTPDGPAGLKHACRFHCKQDLTQRLVGSRDLTRL